MEQSSVFTSLNTSIYIDDVVLGGVTSLSVYERSDDPKNSTYIELKRHVLGKDYLVNSMRTNKFSFRLINNMGSGGYVAELAELDQFEMAFKVDTDGSEMLLEQTLTIKTAAFFYDEDARSVEMKLTEADDVKNLISIIKENQAKANSAVIPNEAVKSPLTNTMTEALNKLRDYASAFKREAPEVQVPDEDLVWLNANNPEQVKDIKPRKLKKNKTKKA